MSWYNPASDLSAAWRGIKHAALSVSKDVLESTPIKVPLDNLFSGFYDKLDSSLQTKLIPNFPRALSVPKPNAFRALAAGKPVNVVPAKGFQLSSAKATASFGIHMDSSGDARLDLNALGPGTNWGKKGAESAVMSVYVDGKYQQDAVLWGGDKKTPYPLLLGNLPAGDHTITLRYAHEKSTAGATGVTITSGTASSVVYKSQDDKLVADHAPILIGRHGGLENNHNDTPLALFHTLTNNPNGTKSIDYGYVFSNEDTGDGSQPAVEQARWGRLTDLETMYRVTLDAKGKVLQEQYEGPGHVWADFKGLRDGTHPIVRTSTDNNNVSDASQGALRFQLPTDNPVLPNAPEEDIMRRNPQFFRAMGEELLKEGKIDPKGTGDRPNLSNQGTFKAIFGSAFGVHQDQMADPRNYLYVQLNAQNATNSPMLVRVTLKNGQTQDSDLGNLDVAINRDGWSQTTVQLPPGTKPQDVAKVAFISKGQGQGQISQVGHLYMLDDAYKPQEISPTIIK
jgi:hypothetical protein